MAWLVINEREPLVSHLNLMWNFRFTCASEAVARKRVRERERYLLFFSRHRMILARNTELCSTTMIYLPFKYINNI